MFYVFLDVDGVINAISTKPPVQNTGWTGEWKTEKVEGWNILWSTELIEHLNFLNTLDDVQIVVLSTWRRRAVDHLFPVVGLKAKEDWVVLNDVEDGHGYTGGWGSMGKWWKLDEVRDFVDAHPEDKFIWLDDDIGWDKTAREYVENHPEILAISPQTPHGLTSGHVKAIMDFINE